MNLIEKVKNYAFNCHSSTNHMYGEHPYSYHLEMVADFARKFSPLLKEEERELAIAGAYVHDTIEDTRQTYNDVREATNELIADIAFALTNEKGKTRKERANFRYYSQIRENDIFIYVKICDRIANILNSKNSNSKMFSLYKKESSTFKDELYIEKFKSMFDYMEEILNGK